MNLPDLMGQSTPIYQPGFNSQLSPRSMWAPEKKETEPKPDPQISKQIEKAYAEEGREAYKNLTEEEKYLLCAGIVNSGSWRRFLKPYLEAFTNPARKPVMSEADQYELLNNNAVAAFIESLIRTIESKARKSPSYSFDSKHQEEVIYADTGRERE